MAGDVSLQMFEEYYKRAKAAEDEGRNVEAKRMYMLAAESLLKAAKQSSGETRAALIRRADKMSRLAELIPETKARPAAETTGGGAKSGDDKPAVEGATTIWQVQGKPNVHFSDIAGLEDVKQTIADRIIQPRLHPEVYKAFNLQPKGGILLYGPPGTGKTMIAKAIATEVDADFFSVRCSDIVGKYFGEAEKNVKALFETARQSESSIIFFDEFEALGAERGSESSGVMNRLVPELLSQMDGFLSQGKGSLMCIAATNRPWSIDSAMLRPPRFTEKVYVGLPDYDARLFLARKGLKDVPCTEDVTPEFIAESTDGYNASDVVNICDKIKQLAVRRSIKQGSIDAITIADVTTTLENTPSSVYKKDIELIKQWEAAHNAKDG